MFGGTNWCYYYLDDFTLSFILTFVTFSYRQVRCVEEFLSQRAIKYCIFLYYKQTILYIFYLVVVFLTFKLCLGWLGNVEHLHREHSTAAALLSTSTAERKGGQISVQDMYICPHILAFMHIFFIHSNFKEESYIPISHQHVWHAKLQFFFRWQMDMFNVGTNIFKH